MFGDAFAASRMAALLLEKGVYVIAFSYPVVPQGKARIRVQVSASHTPEELDFAADQFLSAKQELAL
jgi:glycine C-acetyltransferase